jgi:hypothetical protein
MAADGVTGRKSRVTEGEPRRKGGLPSRANVVIVDDPSAIEVTPYDSLIATRKETKAPIRGPPPPAAYTIATFCLAHDISPAFYYKLRSLGQGPVEMKIGTRRLISFEAAAAWRRARETATA